MRLAVLSRDIKTLEGAIRGNPSNLVRLAFREPKIAIWPDGKIAWTGSGPRQAKFVDYAVRGDSPNLVTFEFCKPDVAIWPGRTPLGLAISRRDDKLRNDSGRGD